MAKKGWYWRACRHVFGKNFFPEGYLFLNPDVAQAGVDPWKHFVKHGQKEGRTAGWPTHEQFDAQRYLEMNEDVKEAGKNPWVHYVKHGHAEGRSNGISHPSPEESVAPKPAAPAAPKPAAPAAPKPAAPAAPKPIVCPQNFNAELYLACNPDLVAANCDPVWHYTHHGAREGRAGASIDSLVKIYGSFDTFDESKRICVVVAHDLSQTGCPINTWNMMHVLKRTHNVIAIALAGGPLEENFREEADVFIMTDPKIRFHDKAINICLREIFDGLDIEFAVVNSIVSRCVLPYFALRRIPALHFIHEFAYYHTKDEYDYSFLNAGQVVFSAEIVLEAAFRKMGTRFDVPVFPQGKSEVPWKKQSFGADERILVNSILTRKTENSEFIFLGVGGVEYRKGVDLFIRTAARIKKAMPEKKFRFLWAGGGWEPEKNIFSRMLEFQVIQYGLEEELEFLGPIKNIDAIYEISDAMLMTSILDPLPGVVIESMFHKKPVLVFEGCSGFPELFEKYGCGHCVARYIDVDDMADKAVSLVKDSELYQATATKQFSLEKAVFDMDAYIRKILDMVPSVKKKLEQEYEEFCASIPEGEIGDISFMQFLPLIRARRTGIRDKRIFALENSRFTHLKPFIAGLKKQIEAPETKSSEELYNLVGQNTGNLAFHYAIDRVLGGGIPVQRWESLHLYKSNFEHKSSHSIAANEEGKIAIIPCANQLGSHLDMGWLADACDKLPNPIVAIGLGAQSEDRDNFGNFVIPRIPDGTKRWLSAITEHSPSGSANIALRGDFSFRTLESLGLADYGIVLGCPTLYINTDPKLGSRIASRIKSPQRVALAAGHPSWRHHDKIENDLSRIIDETDGHFVVAQPLDMIKIGRGEVDMLSEASFRRAHEHFHADLSDEEFREWTKKKGHVFFNVPSWMDFYWQFDFVVGPRIHGIMLALQAGVPALCIAIDSRTKELCETMKVPYVMAADIRTGLTRRDLLKYFHFDPDEFDANRKMLAQRFVHFMESNKIKPDASLYGIAGINSGK